jgi:hypothetical protein
MLVVLDITIMMMTYIDQDFIELVSLLQDATEKIQLLKTWFLKKLLNTLLQLPKF